MPHTLSFLLSMPFVLVMVFPATLRASHAARSSVRLLCVYSIAFRQHQQPFVNGSQYRYGVGRSALCIHRVSSCMLWNRPLCPQLRASTVSSEQRGIDFRNHAESVASEHQDSHQPQFNSSDRAETVLKLPKSAVRNDADFFEGIS